ncbi:MAG TPA: PEP/pyruvate-binding domain-containing protein [Candidatus Limnocylindrales bacterium]|nr:PEP/pyruvate-binding domain-containing protein [Candidatus Limnocylindrales bacterium]
MEQAHQSEMIEWLGSARSGSSALGGKGASLDRLGRMGFRIPPGFCLTTTAFRMQLNAVAGSIVDTAAAERMECAPLETAVAVPLAGAVARLCELTREAGQAAARFAVRSSAIGEDGLDASYAGLHETELDVAPDGVDAAVRRCWASLWSAPAMAYRARRGLPLDGGAMGIVVQALVPADAAIVAFTRHPVTGRADQLVITAVRGLGDAMVSGTVTPDTFIVDRTRRVVTDYAPGEGDGGPVIGGAVLDELIDLILRVEVGFGAPVDIEAAVSDGTWFLLQARPITTGSAVTT